MPVATCDLHLPAFSVAVKMPDQVGSPDALFAVLPHCSSATQAQALAAPRACACAEASDALGACELFSARELCHGQLHVRAPPLGVVSLHVVPAAAVVAGSVVRARSSERSISARASDRRHERTRTSSRRYTSPVQRKASRPSLINVD